MMSITYFLISISLLVVSSNAFTVTTCGSSSSCTRRKSPLSMSAADEEVEAVKLATMGKFKIK